MRGGNAKTVAQREGRIKQKASPERERGEWSAWQALHSPRSRSGLAKNYSFASEKQAISLSLRTKTHFSANAGWLQTYLRPNVAAVCSISFALSTC